MSSSTLTIIHRCVFREVQIFEISPEQIYIFAITCISVVGKQIAPGYAIGFTHYGY